MTRTRTVLAGVVFAATSVGLLQLAFAETQSNMDHAVSATKPRPGKNSAITQISQEGYDAMRAVRAARIAIFDGNSELSTRMVNVAKTDLDKLKAAATKAGAAAEFTLTDSPAELPTAPKYVAVDGMISVVDNFSETPEKKAAIKQANDHIAKGNHAKAIEILKLHDISVTFTRIALPIESSITHVAQASDLIGQGKFYEANLALKAVEDGLKPDTVSIDKSVD